MTHLLFIAIVLLICGCTKSRNLDHTALVEIEGHPYVVFSTPHSTSARTCAIHNRAFTYSIIRQVTVSNGGLDMQANEEWKKIVALKDTAQNAIEIPNSYIVSFRLFNAPTKEITHEERIYEYCATCERIKQDAQKHLSL